MQIASGLRTMRAVCSQFSVATNRIQGYTATPQGAFNHTFTVGNEVRPPVPEPSTATLPRAVARVRGGRRKGPDPSV